MEIECSVHGVISQVAGPGQEFTKLAIVMMINIRIPSLFPVSQVDTQRRGLIHWPPRNEIQ